jgi:phytoene/squalene synthetase
MLQLYNHTSVSISKLVTHTYSTSFSIAVSFLEPEIKSGIYSIYGFVRFADEIVDTFDSFDKKQLLEKFEKDYYEGFSSGISLNPILHSFQNVVKAYKIPDELIQAFLNSMKADLYKNDFNKEEIKEYIYGSAEVVGLMCLRVFTKGDEDLFAALKHPAMQLGSAFQKVNFLRDLKNDIECLDRRYFVGLDKCTFNDELKNDIVKDIENEFALSYIGIKQLPNNSQLAVLTAFYYYLRLLKKIKHTPAKKLMTTRIRITNSKKILLLIKAYFNYKLI